MTASGRRPGRGASGLAPSQSATAIGCFVIDMGYNSQPAKHVIFSTIELG